MQKTAYERRISDWSSDVCSSDRDRLGRVLCGSNLGEGLAIAAPAVAGPISTRIIPDRGLVMSMAGTSGTTTASAFFPTGMLASIGRPTGFTPPYAAALDHGGPALVLQNQIGRQSCRDRVGQSV